MVLGDVITAVMANFTCQLDQAMGCPDVFKCVKRISGCVSEGICGWN